MSVAASSCIPPSFSESEDATDWALLDMRCYIADRPNATTAKGFTSRNLPIEVSFHAARPPVLSHFCVHCPGMDFPGSAPKVVATHADLVLLRVPNPDAVFSSTKLSWDYFIYRAHPPLLDLLPNPYPKRFNDSEVAVLSHSGGYVIATLRNRLPRLDPNGGGRLIRNEFDLHFYYSTRAEEGWISKRLSVDEPLRDTVVPLPNIISDLMMYHESGKTVTVGGERGTVVWVDLWRGMILCDVLDEFPVLRDIPLPPPAIGNWGRLLQQCEPNLLRDVTISRSKDSIKYIEMEIQPPTQGETYACPASYMEWVLKNPRKFSMARLDGWKATIWRIPIPVGSWEDWHKECELDVTEPWLSKLHRDGTEVNLQELSVSHPTMSMDDDVVYLLAKMDTLEMVVAIDVRKKILHGVAYLDSQKDFTWMPNYCSSEITSYL